MSYTFPKFGLPYHAFPSYTFPYLDNLNTSETYTYAVGEVSYLSAPTSGLPDYALPLSGIGGTYLKVYLTNVAVSPQLYKAISNIYSDCYTQIKINENEIAAAASYIVGIDTIEAKVDLLKTFLNTRDIVSDLANVAYIQHAVTIINNSVLYRSGMSDLNDWLNENNVKVKTNWATLCSNTGTTINSENIED